MLEIPFDVYKLLLKFGFIGSGDRGDRFRVWLLWNVVIRNLDPKERLDAKEAKVLLDRMLPAEFTECKGKVEGEISEILCNLPKRRLPVKLDTLRRMFEDGVLSFDEDEYDAFMKWNKWRRRANPLFGGAPKQRAVVAEDDYASKF